MKITESRNDTLKRSTLTANLPRPSSFLNSETSMASVGNLKVQKSPGHKFYIGSMLKKGAYRPFAPKSAQISASKGAKRHLRSTSRGSTSVSPVSSFRYSSNTTPVRNTK